MSVVGGRMTYVVTSYGSVGGRMVYGVTSTGSGWMKDDIWQWLQEGWFMG